MVGILTFHRGPNHGGYLQVFELCKAVEKLGHEVEIIDFQNAHHAKTEVYRPLIYRRPSSFWHGSLKAWAFHKAKEHLPVSARYLDKDKIDWNRYDTILIGADVVWDYVTESLGNEDVYFASFRNKFKGTIAAFAPSCGVADAEGPFPSYVKEGLIGFDRVAVRDEATKALYKLGFHLVTPLKSILMLGTGRRHILRFTVLRSTRRAPKRFAYTLKSMV